MAGPLNDGVRAMFNYLVKLVYRVFAPSNPRGWIDVNVTDEGCKPGTVRVFTDGMDRFGLADLEIIDIPFDLRGYAHGILYEVIWYMKNKKPILADEDLGGSLGFSDPLVFQFLTMRESHSGGMLRMVDCKEPVETGFPARLFASYLNCTAENANEDEAGQMLKTSLQIHPGGTEDADSESTQNPNNFSAHYLLGNLYCHQGNVSEGLLHLKQAADRSSQFDMAMRQSVKASLAASEILPPDEDPRTKFWLSR